MAGQVVDRLERILTEGAAGLANELAEISAPASREKSQGAVAGDIESLFAPPYRVAALLKSEGSQRKAAAWVEAIRAGKGRRLERILRGTRLAGIPVVEAPDEAMHASFLRRGGRRQRVPRLIMRRDQDLARFLEVRRQRVFYGKRGWSDAAGDLGGRQKTWGVIGRRAGEGKVIRDGARVRVEIRNNLPYARSLISRGKRGGRIRKWKKKIEAERFENAKGVAGRGRHVQSEAN